MQATRTYRDLIKPLPLTHSLATVAHNPAHQTCDVCKRGVPDRSRAQRNIISTDYERVDEYPEFPALKYAAQAGCGLCKIIRKAIRQNWAIRPMEEDGVGPLSEKDDAFDELLDVPWDRKVKIFNVKFTFAPLVESVEDDGSRHGGIVTGMTLEFGPANTAFGRGGEELHAKISQVLSFKAFDSIDLDAPSLRARRRLPSLRTLSEENIAMMQTWITECKETHLSCSHPPSTKTWLPTRLLQVGTGASGPSGPRLVETHGMQKGGIVYAALSHVWGDVEAAPPLKTIRGNYDEMKEGIPLFRLPPNFADAVETCRRLGVQFIWIDSLCIIQDSDEDWQQEAGTMHEVYRNAEVTIVATSAASSHDGFLARNTSIVPAIKVQYSLGQGTGSLPQSTSRHVLILVPLGDVEAGLRSGDINASKWNTRGWTMQERSLSTRSIHFCKNKIYFECRECLRSEEGEPERIEAFHTFHMLPWAMDGDRKASDPAQWYRQWRKAVTVYSRRQLTVPSDKLTAIRSLANEMARHLDDTYLAKAGMWKGDLKQEILWHVVSGIPRTPPEQRAPSFSWAALDAHVEFAIGSRSGDVPDALRLGELTLCDADRNIASGLRLKVEGISPTDEPGWKRASFPYDLVGYDGKTFAHGLLDLSNRDCLISGGKSFSAGVKFCYVHVANDQHPSGLILRMQKLSGPFWTRVGVATLFHATGELIAPGVAETKGEFAEFALH